MIQLNEITKCQEMQRVHFPNNEDFLKNYAFKSIPVVIEGLGDSWTVMSKWSLDFFEDRFGQTQHFATLPMDNYDGKKTSLSEYIKYMKDSDVSNPYYLKNCQFHKGTDLVNDYLVPEYFQSWHNILPESIRPFFSWIFLGAKNTFSPIHLDTFDTSAWNLVITGKKLWLFYPPEQKDYLYSGVINPFDPNLEKFPFYRKATPIYCLQNPGEIVFTPSGWWHAVFNLTAGISLTENFVNQTNYQNVYDSITKRGLDSVADELKKIIQKKIISGLHLNPK